MPIERPLEQGREEREARRAAPEANPDMHHESTPEGTPHGTPDGAPDACPAGIAQRRHFVPSGANPYDEVEWDVRTAVIQGEGGETVFEQRDVEVPRAWSQLATNVVVSKYFRGPLGTPQRERSVRQLIGRVVTT